MIFYNKTFENKMQEGGDHNYLIQKLTNKEEDNYENVSGSIRKR